MRDVGRSWAVLGCCCADVMNLNLCFPAPKHVMLRRLHREQDGFF